MIRKSYIALAAVLSLNLSAEVKPTNDSNKDAKKTTNEITASTTIKPKIDHWAGIPEVLAKVDGEAITLTQVKNIVLAQCGGTLPEGLPNGTMKKIIPQIVNELITEKIISQMLIKSKYTLTDEQIATKLKKEFAKIPAQQRKAMELQLSIQKQTIDGYIDSLLKNPQMRKSVLIGCFIEDTITKNIKVDEKEALDYFNKNAEKFVIPGDAKDQIRASHILIMFNAKDVASKEKPTAEQKAVALKKIKEVQVLLKKDSSKFSDFATKYSDCPSKSQGGELGAFGKGQMVPEFEKAAFALKPGELSDIVETQYGYHLIRRDAAKTEKKQTFDEVKASLILAMQKNKQQKALMDNINAERKLAKIEITPIK